MDNDDNIDNLFGKRTLKGMKKPVVESEEKYLDKKDPKRRKMKKAIVIASAVALLGIAATIGITYKGKHDVAQKNTEISQTENKMQNEILMNVQKTWDAYHKSALNDSSLNEIKSNLQRVASSNPGNQKIASAVTPLLDTLDKVLVKLSIYNADIDRANKAYGNGIQYGDMSQIRQARDIINATGMDKDFNPILGPKAMYDKTQNDFHIRLEDRHSTLDGNITAAIANNDANKTISTANRQISRLEADAHIKAITYNGQINAQFQIICCAEEDKYSGKSIIIRIHDLKRNVKQRYEGDFRAYDALVQASANFPFDYKALFKDGTIRTIKIGESGDNILLEVDGGKNSKEFPESGHGRAFDILYSKILQNCDCKELRSTRY
jgi:hypothetical protein